MPSQVRFAASFVAVWVLAVPSLCPAAPDDVQLRGAAMLACSGLPCLDVRVGADAHVKMLIDTGNAVSVLDRAVAQRLGLKLEPYVGRDGKVHPEYAKATLAGVKIGSRALGEVVVLVMDLAADISKGEMPDAEGTLAYTAFGPRQLRMDYKYHRVELSGVLAQEHSGPMHSSSLTLPSFGQHGPPVVVTNGFRVNGKLLTVQIDTLYTGTLLIYPTAVERLGLSSQQKGTVMRTFPFTDGGVQMIGGKAASIGFLESGLAADSPVYFATPAVHIPDGMFDGTVGQELFAGRVLMFDFHSHWFWIA